MGEKNVRVSHIIKQDKVWCRTGGNMDNEDMVFILERRVSIYELAVQKRARSVRIVEKRTHLLSVNGEKEMGE